MTIVIYVTDLVYSTNSGKLIKKWPLTQAIIYAALAIIKQLAEYDWASAGLAAVIDIESEDPPSPLAYIFCGLVPGFGDSDSEMSLLTPGEFVNRKPVVQKLGRRFFEILNSDPVNPNIDGVIASLKVQRNSSSTGNSTYPTTTIGSTAVLDNTLVGLNNTVNRLIKKLDVPIKAIAYYEPDELPRLRKVIADMTMVESQARYSG